MHEYYSQWRGDGTFQNILDSLRGQIRVAVGRDETPSAACIDSQSVKTTEVGGDDRGYDGGKKIKGRKRHLLVDTLGLLIAVVVTSAAIDDGVAAPLLLAKVTPAALPRLSTIFGDNKNHNHNLNEWLAAMYSLRQAARLMLSRKTKQLIHQFDDYFDNPAAVARMR